MVYTGGLTFDSEHPSEFLKIPNGITAHRFGKTLLDRLGIHATMSAALRTLSATGAPDQVLSGYLRLMQQSDVGDHSFGNSEGVHRDSLWVVILENPSLTASAEFGLLKVRITHRL